MSIYEIINASLNALGAIYQMSHGELFLHANIRAQVKNICFESTNILNHAGFAIAPDNMWENLQKLLPNISTNHSSMAVDVAQGKPTEIKHINGYLVDFAQQYGLSCRYNLQIVNDLENCHV